jgi:hypothetical protein
MWRILHKKIGAATTPSGDGADASFLRFTVSRCTTDAYCHPLPCPKAWLFSYVVDTTTTYVAAQEALAGGHKTCFLKKH